MDSILSSIKKMLGITEDYEYFDTDLIININSVFSVLTQLGVGPDEGFFIEDSYTTWEDYLEDNIAIEFIKSYVYLKVKLIFDPPLSSSVLEAIQNQIKELEWRINVAVDPRKEV